ncbi:hypothetical protein PISMIDRAFT_689460 [Pisolithus microcarpus 441]|uniref:Uncharacterized protein n=1 Tax=Pisolithus microcarpus 441 TaxID=765257 RepID=A0A0C9YPZ4_9AGAM|nr:hypothetical protein PISMIDRAFT_689460 [Pisolithus microcarpus 441]
MRKAANFLVEAQRLEGILTRIAQRRSNDGSNPGTHVSVPTCVVHRNNAVYDNPGVFSPPKWRS